MSDVITDGRTVDNDRFHARSNWFVILQDITAEEQSSIPANIIQDHGRVGQIFHFDQNEIQWLVQFIQPRKSDIVNGFGFSFRRFAHECDDVIIAPSVFSSPGQTPEEVNGLDTIDVLQNAADYGVEVLLHDSIRRFYHDF